MENINLWMITAVSMKNGDVVRNDSIEGETQMAADKQASTHLDKYAEAGRAAIARDIDLSLAAAQGAATFEDALQVLAVHARLMIDAHQCALSRIDHRFGNEGDFGRPERFSESFAIDPVQVE